MVRTYWPRILLMLGLIDEGLAPCPFFEGDYTSRLEILADIPKGKACYAFERTDILKAKEVLGDQVCIRGNVPLSLLVTGTPDEVKDYCKKLIDVVGKRGGYIMDASAGFYDAELENVKAMIDFRGIWCMMVIDMPTISKVLLTLSMGQVLRRLGMGNI